MLDKHWMKYAAGFLAGSVGLEILKSGVAQKVYTVATAGVFLARDRVLEEAEKIHSAACDISEDAKEMTERYYQEKDAEFDQGIDVEVEDVEE